jgi:hypothetical protein
MRDDGLSLNCPFLGYEWHSHHMIDLAVARNRLVLGMRDVTGGIWMLDHVDR